MAFYTDLTLNSFSRGASLKEDEHTCTKPKVPQDWIGREIPKPDREFEVQRFRQREIYEDKSWIYRSSRKWPKWDRIGFFSDKEIQITGVGYYGCSDAYDRIHGCIYDIVLEIKNYDREHSVLAHAEAMIVNKGEQFRVNFKRPIVIHGGLRYIISSSCRGPKSFFGKEGEKSVTVSCDHYPVTFNFLEAKHSFAATATGVNMGVIPNIFFNIVPDAEIEEVEKEVLDI